MSTSVLGGGDGPPLPSPPHAARQDGSNDIPTSLQHTQLPAQWSLPYYYSAYLPYVWYILAASPFSLTHPPVLLPQGFISPLQSLHTPAFCTPATTLSWTPQSIPLQTTLPTPPDNQPPQPILNTIPQSSTAPSSATSTSIQQQLSQTKPEPQPQSNIPAAASASTSPIYRIKILTPIYTESSEERSERLRLAASRRNHRRPPPLSVSAVSAPGFLTTPNLSRSVTSDTARRGICNSPKSESHHAPRTQQPSQSPSTFTPAYNRKQRRRMRAARSHKHRSHTQYPITRSCPPSPPTRPYKSPTSTPPTHVQTQSLSTTSNRFATLAEPTCPEPSTSPSPICIAAISPAQSSNPTTTLDSTLSQTHITRNCGKPSPRLLTTNISAQAIVPATPASETNLMEEEKYQEEEKTATHELTPTTQDLQVATPTRTPATAMDPAPVPSVKSTSPHTNATVNPIPARDTPIPPTVPHIELASISPTTTIAIDQGEEKDIGPTPDLDTLKLKVTSHTPSHTQALSTQLSIADQEETKSQDHETKASSKKKEKEKKKPPSAKPPHTVLAAATASQPTCVTSAAISNSTSLTVDTSSARSLRSSMCQACRCVTNIDVMKASPNFPFKSQVPPGWSSPNICILCLIVFLTGHRRQRLAFEMAIQEKYSSCSHPHYKQWIAFANSEDDEELDANVARMFQVGKSLLSESYWMSRWTTEEEKKCRD